MLFPARKILSMLCLLGAGSACSSGAALNPERDEEPIGSSTAPYEAVGDAAFVWASNATGSYDAAPAYSYNNSGRFNHITNTGLGRYSVTFNGINLALGGNVQVTAYGSGTERCKVESWGGNTAIIRCFTPAGGAVNTLFTASYQRRTGTPGQLAGYVWDDGENILGDYFPIHPYQWNSAGGSIRLHRDFTGQYYVCLPNQGVLGRGTVEVTAYGTDNNYCVGSGNFESLGCHFVNCYNQSGNLTNTKFSFVMGKGSPNNTSSYAYAFNVADPPPVPQLQYGAIATGCGVETPTSAPSITGGNGIYAAHFPQMNVSASNHSNVIVTAAGGPVAAYCKVVNWGNELGGVLVNVRCFTPAGALTSAYFGVVLSTLQTGCVVP